MGKMLLVCCALALASTQAQAACRDDLKDVRPRVDHLKSANLARYQIANRWWVLGQEASGSDEVQCLNYYTRVMKALNEPIEQVNNCLGPNAYLPQCYNGGPNPAVGTYGAVVGGAGGGGAGGGGGAAGNAGQTPFNPPGSVGSVGGTVSPQ